MSGGLITSLLLDEAYVVGVLGFDKKTLNEGRYNVRLQQAILEEHLLAENWFKKSIDFLKDKGAEGLETLKDKALEVPNAIKQYGSDLKGVVAAIAAMVRDPEELSAYANGIYGNIRLWPKGIIKALAKIKKWMEEHSMPTFAKGVDKIIGAIKSLFEAATSAKGWKAAVSMLSFGLAVKYIEEEFGVLEKARKFRDVLSDPKELIPDLVDAIGEREEVDDIKDFFAGNITAVVEDSELFKKITKFLADKLGFLEEIKNKFIGFGKQIAGKALEQFAGPIAWIKQLAELFKSSEWVVSNLASMLTSMKIGTSFKA